MYEQVRQGDRDGISIDEEFLKNTLDKQASNDQKTTQIVSQTKTAISRRGRPWECDHHTLDAITTGAALVLRLVTGSSTKPHDFPHFGHGCNLPVRNIVCNGFLTEKPKRQKLVSNVMATADVLTTMDMQDCWAEGLLDTVSWSI
jgi:hypothetical protein